MNKTRIGLSAAAGLAAGMLFARSYDCNVTLCLEIHIPPVLSYYWQTVILTAPAWLALAVLAWFVLPTVLRIADRCLYAIGVDTSVIASRWRRRK
jgi:hypothetical protein